VAYHIPVICLGFWRLGDPGVRRLGHTCVRNLYRVGAEVCAKFGGDWYLNYRLL